MLLWTTLCTNLKLQSRISRVHMRYYVEIYINVIVSWNIRPNCFLRVAVCMHSRERGACRGFRCTEAPSSQEAALIRPQCLLEEAGWHPETGQDWLFHSNLMPPGNSHKSKTFSQKLLTLGVSNIPWTQKIPIIMSLNGSFHRLNWQLSTSSKWLILQ